MEWEVILSICGGIAVVSGALTAIGKWTKPITKIKKDVESHELRIDKVERDNQAVLNALYALLDHEITNNSIDKLKTAREHLTHYIIEK